MIPSPSGIRFWRYAFSYVRNEKERTAYTWILSTYAPVSSMMEEIDTLVICKNALTIAAVGRGPSLEQT